MPPSSEASNCNPCIRTLPCMVYFQPKFRLVNAVRMIVDSRLGYSPTLQRRQSTKHLPKPPPSIDRIPEVHGRPRSPCWTVGPYGLPNTLFYIIAAPPGPCHCRRQQSTRESTSNSNGRLETDFFGTSPFEIGSVAVPLMTLQRSVSTTWSPQE
jgi:hypothetical protein